jgi:serine/threonine-protein kinase
MKNVVNKSLQNGKYSLEQELGRGSFGITYKAINNILEQRVAIKMLNVSLEQNYYETDLVRQFQDEARRLAKCSHPNIVRVIDFFRENELPYIVMEYIPGLTLDRIVFPDNPLSEIEAIAYIKQVGEALTVIHNQGLLHGDIKPKNLILRQDNQQVVLIDFGIAREFSSEQLENHTNWVSEGYAPIEQYLFPSKRTIASDIYGLAATLYTLLTATIPPSAISRFHGFSLESPQQLRPQLSEQVSEAVMWGMALEAENRPSSLSEWLTKLTEDRSKAIVFVKSASSLVKVNRETSKRRDEKNIFAKNWKIIPKLYNARKTAIFTGTTLLGISVLTAVGFRLPITQTNLLNLIEQNPALKPFSLPEKSPQPSTKVIKSSPNSKAGTTLVSSPSITPVNRLVKVEKADEADKNKIIPLNTTQPNKIEQKTNKSINTETNTLTVKTTPFLNPQPTPATESQNNRKPSIFVDSSPKKTTQRQPELFQRKPEIIKEVKENPVKKFPVKFITKVEQKVEKVTRKTEQKSDKRQHNRGKGRR